MSTKTSYTSIVGENRVVMRIFRLEKQREILQRTGPPAFIPVYNNAVINLNQLVQKLLKGTHRCTDRQS